MGKNLLISLILVFVFMNTLVGQTTKRRLSMEQTIKLAQERSISSMVNKNVFASAYWSYRSYKASRLPSLNISTGILNLDRSIVSLQDAETGLVSYKDVYTLSNDATLFVRQRIAATGGTISLSSSLRRLDQFNPDNLTYYSQPITLTYMQPLWTFNAYKWSKKIEPHNFDRAKIEYLEAMETVTIQAVGYFWELARAELNHDIALSNYETSKRLYAIAQERHKLGSVKKNEVLQLELKVLNDSIAINTYMLSYTAQCNRLASFIGLPEGTSIELIIDYDLPTLQLNYEQVLQTALKNSSFNINRKIEQLQAERSIAQAEANRGIEVSFNARFGLSQSGDSFYKAYSHLRDQEVVGFTVSFPIVDWGLGKGQVQMAKSSAETIYYKQEQALIDYRQDLFVKVMEFNAQQTQCKASMRANDIAQESFDLSVDSYARGTLSIVELNNVQSEKDNAQRNYLSSLASYWSYYFNLRKLSLYDYLSNTDINTEFDSLVKEQNTSTRNLLP